MRSSAQFVVVIEVLPDEHGGLPFGEFVKELAELLPERNIGTVVQVYNIRRDENVHVVVKESSDL